MYNQIIIFAKKRWYLILLAIISIGLVIVYLFSQPKSPTTTTPGPTENLVQVTKILPVDRSYPAGGSRNPVFVYTNTELNPELMTATSSPSLRFDLKVRFDDPLRLIIQPRTPWETGVTYTIYIKGKVFAKNGRDFLNEDIIIPLEIVEQPTFAGGEGD